MSAQLNVIALISGGKDSIYSLLHCLENGHRIIALANLYPKDAEKPEASTPGGGDEDGENEDLNSFMYQTVGYSIIPLYAECFRLPLYRRAIIGSAIQTGRYYDASEMATAGDETEDLVPLLQEIKHNHPEANAVCSGAILSTYQRTRVESIAVRLGLTPLAYLWQYPALPSPNDRFDSLTGLLEDMAFAQCDARIIKIASGGIQESLLWSNVADARTRKRLVSGLAPFFPGHEFWLRSAVLGEGGEYETLAINGPKRLWKRRIEVPKEQRAILTADGGVSYIKLNRAKTVEQDPSSDEQEPEAVRIPRSLDEQFHKVFVNASTWRLETQKDHPGSDHERSSTVNEEFSFSLPEHSQTLTSTNLALANLTVKGTPVHDAEHLSAAKQMEHICDFLQSVWGLRSAETSKDNMFTSSNIVSTTLLLRDISDFVKVNAVYASLFCPGEPNPPARVTFACELPPGIEVSLSVLLNLGSREKRRGLHVQSRSYWAPANIGPYSQAICEPLDQNSQEGFNIHDAGLVEIVHIAGQIPLVPQSMQILEADFLEQTVLSLQHLWRVGQERGVDVWPWGISFLKNHDESNVRAAEACKVWQHAHLIGTKSRSHSSDSDDDEGLDVWDLHFNRSAAFQSANSGVRVGEHLHDLPNSDVFLPDESTATFIPPFIAATVSALPRDAPVEWWSLGIANLPQSSIAKPRVTTIAKTYGWGSAGLMTILPAATSQEQPLQGGALHTDLVAVTVNFSREADIDIVSIERDLTNLLMPETNTDSVTHSRLHMVQGTTFVAPEGQSFWTQATKLTLFSQLTAVPCASVFGSAARTSSSESSEFSNPINTAPSAISQSTDADCQPLTLAITMRIERTSNF